MDVYKDIRKMVREARRHGKVSFSRYGKTGYELLKELAVYLSKL